MRPASTAHERARHRDGSVSPREKAVKKVSGKQLRGAGGFKLDFWIIYKIATEFILQITHNFSKEVENLQKWKLLNFSNSTTLLQGIFSNSACILKFEFEVHLSIWIISKLLQILYVNFKNFEYQSWSL